MFVWVDKPELIAVLFDLVVERWACTFTTERPDSVFLLDLAQDLFTVHSLECLVCMTVLHILDESYFDVACHTILHDIEYLIIVDPFERYHVDLDTETYFKCFVDPFEYLSEYIFLCDLVCDLRFKGIK